MSVDLQRILESKRFYRQKLARRTVAEKLGMLDELRDRARTIRKAAQQHAMHVRESTQEYRARRRKN